MAGSLQPNCGGQATNPCADHDDGFVGHMPPVALTLIASNR
jgi:hypothetical protein